MCDLRQPLPSCCGQDISQSQMEGQHRQNIQVLFLAGWGVSGKGKAYFTSRKRQSPEHAECFQGLQEASPPAQHVHEAVTHLLSSLNPR